MTRRTLFTLTGGLAATAVIGAWTAPRLGAQAGQDATIASVKTVHEIVKGYVMKAAAQVPEDKYKYQPTPEVRTMGQIFGHIANASRMICSTASGMAVGEVPDAEKLATKAEIERALQDALLFCDHAITMITPARANETVELFGMTHSRLGALGFNNAHNFEHYGNIVTYMRLNGMVPPSSQSGGGE